MTPRKLKKGQTNFDKAEYAKQDARAKAATVNLLERFNFCLSVETNPDDGNDWSFKLPDVIAHTTSGDVLVEAQVNAQWTAEKTKASGRPYWSTFRCWHRKMNQACFVKKGERGYWLTARNDLKFGIMCPMDAAVVDRSVEYNWRYGKTSNVDPWELAFHLDLSKCKFVNFVDGTIEPYQPEAL